MALDSESQIQRERNGCLTCRKRKKKCDRTYPVCNQCSRLNFSCQREDLRHPRPRAGRPRRREKDEPEPSSSRVLPQPCAVILRGPDISSFWIQNESGNDRPSKRTIMRYYIQHFTTLLTTTLENNCFLSVFLPMSMESPLLHDAITAWASSHLALQDKSHEYIAIANRCTALNALSTSLSSHDRQYEMELASCLIHCAMESITGDTKQWYSHLVGAYEVIRSIGAVPGSSTLDFSSFSSTVEGRWLLANFAYHDIMMTVAEDRKPLLMAGEYWNFSSSNGVANSYFGLASEIMALISETSILNVDMLEQQDEISTSTQCQQGPDQFSVRAQQIQHSLQTWTCPSTSNPSLTLVHLAESYRSAALIHLYRTIRRNRPHLSDTLSTKITEQVSSILEYIEAIPEGSLVESALLLPLFLAGGEAEDPKQIQIVRQRMTDVIETRHFHNVQAVLQVLEEVWFLRATRAQGSGGRRVDWKDVLNRKGWMLSIT